jgi:hypothetical protein
VLERSCYIIGMKKKTPRDLNKLAAFILDEATNEVTETDEPSLPKKNQAAVELGRLGGLKGGKARAESLTASQRRKIAIKAATARWKKK